MNSLSRDGRTRNKVLRRALGVLLVIGVLIVTGMLTTRRHVDDANALQGGLTFSQVGTHPQAVLQPTTEGKTLRDLAVRNDKLYSGYGDYGVNTGPIIINPFNLISNTFEGPVLTVPTDQIGVFRDLGGVFYAPYIDPTAPWTSNVGYASMDGAGTWQNNDKIPAIHILDMAKLGSTNLFMVGSNTDTPGHYVASIFRSVDNGVNWTNPITEFGSSGLNNELDRFYWVAELGGKIYAQSRTTPQKALRIFNGTSWSTGTTQAVCPVIDAHLVETFAGKIVCTNALATIRMFNGTAITTATSPVGTIYDFYKAGDGYLYVLGNGGIARTNDLVSWQVISGRTFTNGSIAVYNDRVYIGDNASKLYRSDMTIANAPIVFSNPVIGAIYDSATFELSYEVGSTSAVTFLIDGSEFQAGAVVKIADQVVTPDSITSTGIYITLTTAQLLALAPHTQEVGAMVNNPDGGTVTSSAGAAMTLYVPGPTVISNASFQTDQSGRKVLVVEGNNFTNGSSSYYNQAITKSFLTFNGVAMPVCVDGFGVTSAQLVSAGYNPKYFSDTSPCYEVRNPITGPTIRYNRIVLRLANGFDTSQVATVQVTSIGNSNVYELNTPIPPPQITGSTSKSGGSSLVSLNETPESLTETETSEPVKTDTSDETKTDNSSGQSSSEASGMPIWVIIMIAAIGLIGFFFIILGLKRRKKDEDS